MIRKETWIVLAIFVAALAGLLLWQRYGEDAADAEATLTPGASTSLFNFAADSLQSVRLERLGDKVVEFHRESGVWQIIEPPGLQGDSTSLESSLSQLAFVSGETMENVPPMDAMGLDKPEYRIRLTLTDGAEQTAYVGKATPTGGGYYVIGSDQQVYVVNTYALDPILGLMDDLPLQPTPTSADAYPLPETTEAVPAGTP